MGLEEVWLIVMILEQSKVFAKYPWELTFQMNDQTAALVQFLRRLRSGRTDARFSTAEAKFDLSSLKHFNDGSEQN